MKGSEGFKAQINGYLQGEAAADELFAETLKKPNKNLDECVGYIMSEVQKSGNNGFADAEIFGMAKHYYDEDDLKPGKAPGNARVVVNHHAEGNKQTPAQPKAAAPAPAPKKPVKEKFVAPQLF